MDASTTLRIFTHNCRGVLSIVDARELLWLVQGEQRAFVVWGTLPEALKNAISMTEMLGLVLVYDYGESEIKGRKRAHNIRGTLLRPILGADYKLSVNGIAPPTVTGFQHFSQFEYALRDHLMVDLGELVPFPESLTIRSVEEIPADWLKLYNGSEVDLTELRERIEAYQTSMTASMAKFLQLTERAGMTVQDVGGGKAVVTTLGKGYSTFEVDLVGVQSPEYLLADMRRFFSLIANTDPRKLLDGWLSQCGGVKAADELREQRDQAVQLFDESGSSVIAEIDIRAMMCSLAKKLQLSKDLKRLLDPERNWRNINMWDFHMPPDLQRNLYIRYLKYLVTIQLAELYAGGVKLKNPPTFTQVMEADLALEQIHNLKATKGSLYRALEAFFPR